MNVDGLVSWARKGASLRKKYEKQKRSLVDDICKEAGLRKKFLFWKNKHSDSGKIMKYRDSLLNVIFRRQIPLYNNIINYSDIALGIFSKNKEKDPKFKVIKDQIISLTNYSKQVRNILDDQIKILQRMTLQNYELQIGAFMDYHNSEKDILKSMKKDARKMGKLQMKILKKNMKRIRKAKRKAEDKSYKALIYVQKHRVLFSHIKVASLAVMAIASLADASLGDQFKYIYRFASVLEKV